MHTRHDTDPDDSLGSYVLKTQAQGEASQEAFGMVCELAYVSPVMRACADVLADVWGVNEGLLLDRTFGGLLYSIPENISPEGRILIRDFILSPPTTPF